MRYLLQASLASSTIIAYERHWDNFQAFVEQVLRAPFVMPVDSTVLAQYISYLTLKGYSYSTILTNISVVSFAHKIRNMKDPAVSFLIHKLLLGVRNKLGKPDKRKPITVVILRKLVHLIQATWGDSGWRGC